MYNLPSTISRTLAPSQITLATYLVKLLPIYFKRRDPISSRQASDFKQVNFRGAFMFSLLHIRRRAKTSPYDGAFKERIRNTMISEVEVWKTMWMPFSKFRTELEKKSPR